MQDNVSVIIATILAVVIIVLFPIYNVATRQDSIANNMVVKATTSFVDEVRNKGYIEAEEYGNFLKELDKTGNTYDVEMEVHKPTFVNTGTDEYEEKYVIEYTNSVLDDMKNATLANNSQSVINENIYYLGDGYKFYIRVKNTNITQAQVLLDRLLGGESKERIVVNYGGKVYTNEWAKGEGAQTTVSNISISRPMNYNLEEFKYEHITTLYDQLTGESQNIYGIAVRLSSTVANNNIINFVLSYTNVEALEDEDGKILTTSEERIKHIAKYFEMLGFEGYISIKEGQATQKNRLYTYQYLITITDVKYDYENNSYVRATVQIIPGSAYTSSGALGLLKSQEFIITGKNELEPQLKPESTNILSGQSAIQKGVQIGDNVRYSPKLLEGTKYENYKYAWLNGWKYIGIDKYGNALLILADQTLTGLGLSGLDGFINGTSKLNTICKEVFSSDLGDARSINMDDIERMLGKEMIGVYTNKSGKEVENTDKLTLQQIYVGEEEPFNELTDGTNILRLE